MASKKKKGKVIQMPRSMSPSKYIVRNGRKLKIHEVLWSIDLLDVGKGNIFVIREKSNGDLIMCSYLVDTYCLGIKDTFYKVMTRLEYTDFKKRIIESSPSDIESIEANYAYNIIYGALEYAEDLGIQPHKDFKITEYLLDPPETLEFVDIEFGLNGKPCFIFYAGDRIGKIISALNTSVGRDGYTLLDGNLSYGNDYEDMSAEEGLDEIFSFAESNLARDNDRAAYTLYGSTVHYFNAFYNNNIKELNHLYCNDQEALVRDIQNNIGSDEINYYKLKGLVISAVEKYLIYEDIEFLFEDYILDAFDSDSEEDVIKSIAHINVYLYGIKKIEALLCMLKDYISITSKSLTTDKDLEKLLEDFRPEKQDSDYPTYLILSLLADHEMEFGKIDFDLLNLTLNK